MLYVFVCIDTYMYIFAVFRIKKIETENTEYMIFGFNLSCFH